MSKIDSIKEKANAAEDMAHKIWLAGLGAYGKGYDEAKGRFEELNSDASKLFEELVAKGKVLEADTKEIFKGKASQADSNIKERVAQVRESLGMNSTDSNDKIDELSSKIDTLTDIVEKLSKV